MKDKTHQTAILLIYTGGTIGMIQNLETGVLEPFNFQHLQQHIPDLNRLNCEISTVQFETPLDSSEIGPESWVKIAKIISDNYAKYDGFVVLHGTDTMAFTASALSFMLENLSKPVILTGSQLPLGMLRTDGKENLVTAIEIAAARDGDMPIIQEVCIFFENDLMRGNRTSKTSADNFNAFHSYNYPVLAHAGITIHYNLPHIYHPILRKPLKPHFEFDNHIAILKLFPGLAPSVVESLLNTPDLKGVVLETFGSGNAPMAEWFLSLLKKATDKDIVAGILRDLMDERILTCENGLLKMQEVTK